MRQFRWNAQVFCQSRQEISGPEFHAPGRFDVMSILDLEHGFADADLAVGEGGAYHVDATAQTRAEAARGIAGEYLAAVRGEYLYISLAVDIDDAAATHVQFRGLGQYILYARLLESGKALEHIAEVIGVASKVKGVVCVGHKRFHVGCAEGYAGDEFLHHDGFRGLRIVILHFMVHVLVDPCGQLGTGFLIIFLHRDRTILGIHHECLGEIDVARISGEDAVLCGAGNGRTLGVGEGLV